MIASGCGCRVKSYRAKHCCGKWFCPPCYEEHRNSKCPENKKKKSKLETLKLIFPKPTWTSEVDDPI